MVNKNDELRARLLVTFRVEAEEHLQVLTTNLLALGRELPAPEVSKVIDVSFREMHTLKGAARSVGLIAVEGLCQACESVLSKLSRGQLVLTSPTLKMLHEAVEHMPLLLTGGTAPSAVNELIRRLKGIVDESLLKVAQPVEASESPIPVAKAALETGLPSTNTIRLNTSKLDGLLLQAEDLLLPKLAAGERVQEVRALVETVRGCRTALFRERAGRRSPHETSSAVALVVDPDSVMETVETRIRAMLEQISHDHRTITLAVDGLQQSLRQLRMTPASVVLNLFPGMVHSLAAELGKQVEWTVHGTDLEVDRKVLDAMKDPLIHLVRNAVDHGIESPETRVKAGKSPQGLVAVTISSLEGNRIEIRIEDDGKGIDLDQVRAAAVRARHLTAEESQALTNEGAMDLIYRSGLSTTPLVNTVSGHGLGLAIVREQVEDLKGQIRVDTRPGAGTTVRITLPVTISTFRGLLVRAGGQRYVLPSEAVERTFRILQREVESTQGRPMIRWEGQPVLLAQLTELLGLPTRRDPSESDRKQPCVIMRVRESRVAIAVDDVLGEQEVVVKELGSPLVRVRNVAGAGLLGTGHIILILRPTDLLKSIRESPHPSLPFHLPKETPCQPVVLVVDDSITTRTMEKNLLEAAGYQVRVAVDGIEAWTFLKTERVDLVVSDVDMPRMDGLELTSKIRADREMADLPVVLVTALESRDDKERGLEVGANAYLVKSSFDQSNLLEFIQRLL